VKHEPSPHRIPEEWGLTHALIEHPGLKLIPRGGDNVLLAGELRFAAKGADATVIEDSYSVELRIPRSHPMRELPQAFETGGRIPNDYHHLADGSLCLGSPTRLRLIVLRSPTISDFIAQAVIPYFYSRSYYERFGQMPFGELAHGNLGLTRDLISMLRMPMGTRVDQLLDVCSMRKRHANKRACPCGSGLRLGKCHNREVNSARAQFGRSWFAGQSMQLFGAPSSSRRRTQTLSVRAGPRLRQ
jgi:hypothetical protein